jgi:hypothetical protein
LWGDKRNLSIAPFNSDSPVLFFQFEACDGPFEAVGGVC